MCLTREFYEIKEEKEEAEVNKSNVDRKVFINA